MKKIKNEMKKPEICSSLSFTTSTLSVFTIERESSKVSTVETLSFLAIMKEEKKKKHQ